MTQEAINQMFNNAHNGDVFAMTLAGQLLCEGRFVQQNLNNGFGWLQRAAQSNCIYARDLMVDVQNGCYSQPMSSASQPKTTPQLKSRHEVTSNPHEELDKLIGLSSVKQ